LGEALS
jgi:mycothiol synthase